MFAMLSAKDVVLVTGATGTLGQALTPKLLETGCTVRALSRDEVKQGECARRFPGVDWMLGDVRDAAKCRSAVRGATVVIHAASLKYVDRSEVEPREYTLTNVIGTINMIDAVQAEHGVRHMIGISTDKAPNAINTYGLTKALLEKLFIAASYQQHNTLFTVCRYGNVMGSRGSVAPKWQEDVKAGRRIQVTEPTMTRFFFTVQDALELIDFAFTQKTSGMIVSLAMASTELGELAALFCKDYIVVGVRAGEKLDEELFSSREMRKVHCEGKWLVYDPAQPLSSAIPWNGYTSANCRRLTKEELLKLTGEWRCQE